MSFLVSADVDNTCVFDVLFDRSGTDDVGGLVRNWPRPFELSAGIAFCDNDEFTFGWPRRVNWA